MASVYLLGVFEVVVLVGVHVCVCVISLFSCTNSRIYLYHLFL